MMCSSWYPFYYYILCESCVSLNQYSVGMISDTSYTGMVSLMCELSCLTLNYLSREWFLTCLTLVWFLPCVNHHACDELMFQCKRFTADITLIWFFTCVNCHVSLNLPFSVKYLVHVLNWYSFITRVNSQGKGWSYGPGRMTHITHYYIKIQKKGLSPHPPFALIFSCTVRILVKYFHNQNIKINKRAT